MQHENLTYDDLLRIVELIKSSEQFSEFRLKIGEIEIELRRRRATEPTGSSVAAPAQPGPRSSAAPSPSVSPVPAGGSPAASHAPASSQASAPSQAPAPGAWPEESLVIRAPMVGTFYRAPEPGAPPFVEVGQQVEPDTVVCIIEVMKLMNSIPAGTRGTVLHILVAEAAPVEAGQALIVLQPAAEPE